MPETKQQRQSRFLERDLERAAKEQTAKEGIASLWKSLNPAQKIGMSPVGFPLTDIIGAAGDIQMYREEPETRSGLNYALSGLGLLPFVPPVASTVLKGKAKYKPKKTTIVHGTTKDVSDALGETGEITPTLGSFVEDMYITRGDYGSLDEFELPDMVSFHTSIDDPSSAIAAMEAQVGYKLGKPYEKITLKEIKEHGAILLSEVDPETVFKYADDEMNIVNLKGKKVYIDEPLGFEREDIISFLDVKPTRKIEGKDLIAFIKEHQPERYMKQEAFDFYHSGGMVDKAITGGSRYI
jgi:hypothetical protein